MKIPTFLLLGICLAFGPHAPASEVIRIAYSADGNQHDADDWHASSMALALIAYAGTGFRLVHFDYNDHLGDNSPRRSKAHHEVVMEAIRNYGYDQSMVFNDQWDLTGAVNSIAKAIDASTENDRLYLLCAGPMEVCWQGINAARHDRRPYVTVVSHSSGWNDTHADTAQMTHVWADIRKDFRVEAWKIRDQNQTAFRSHPSQWIWLRDLDHGYWLYSAIAEGPKAGDASDAGMVYWVLDGRTAGSETPSMSDIRARFSGSPRVSGSLVDSLPVPNGR